MQLRCLTLVLLPGLLGAPPGLTETIPDAEKLEASGAVVGEIILDRENVFDLSDPEENNWLFRFANRIHIVTRDKVIRKQLLLRPGDEYSKRLSDETERILRRNRYLYDADIVPVAYEDGVVDLKVTTRDLWSLMPELSWSRAGGENSSRYGLQESNLLGTGARIAYYGDSDVDRDSQIYEYTDRHLGRSWVSASLVISNNSDGHANYLSAIRPFYKLDARWSAGTTLSDNDRRGTLYNLGSAAAEYQQERDYFTAFYGWSRGLQNNRARRWTLGVAYDNNTFTTVPDGTLPAAIPEDRLLVYPYLYYESIENRFETAKNRNQMSQTEDFLMGRRVTARVGWSDTSFGADRNALIFSGSVSQSWGTVAKTALQASVSAEGRVEDGEAANTLAHLRARYYHKQTDKLVFYASLRGTAGYALDLDNPVQLGGDSGLRGFPLRYQNGESKIIATVEQRYFTDWYPFRIVRVGAALFTDVGRVWGDSPVGEERLGWLADVGFGLRLALTRSTSQKMVHVDIAFPLNGDDSIDSVQFLIESRRSF